MPNNNYPKEGSELLRKIESLDFVNGKVKIESVNRINCKNFNNTLVFNKNLRNYIANISCSGSNYKILIPIKGNRPNPKYERKLRKFF